MTQKAIEPVRLTAELERMVRDSGLGGASSLTDKRIGELAHAVIDRANGQASNSNFTLQGFDVYRAGLIIQATISVLRDEGLLVTHNA